MGIQVYFQYKTDKLIGDIEGVKTYIDYILVLGKGVPPQHIDPLSCISPRIIIAGLKVNAQICTLGLNEITYLGYIIIQGVIK